MKEGETGKEAEVVKETAIAEKEAEKDEKPKTEKKDDEESSDDEDPAKLKTIEECIQVKDTSLSFKKGEFVCIVGEIGSGKTSLINSILGELIYVSNDTLKALGSKKSEVEEVQEMLKIGSMA